MRIEAITGALADLTRLRILRLLGQLELAVGELAQVLGQSQPRVSRHVAVLADAGLVERRREGSWVFLRRALSADIPEAIGEAVAAMIEAGETGDVSFRSQCNDDRRHLAAIRDAREKAAEAYFASHAAEWDEWRALLSPAEKVEQTLLEELGNAPLGRLLDIGTGTGRMAELLSARSSHVVALDRSPEMLRLARARLQTLEPEHWELVQGDFATLPFAPDSFDTLILHQVLHFAGEPFYALSQAARVCCPGGRVVIVDFAAHDREDLRRRHAHVRLGFTPEQMSRLLADVGFSAPEPIRLHGNGLTTLIWIGEKLAPAAPS